MCQRVTCPNDGKPTWRGCGRHVEDVLGDVPKSERCQCKHESVPFIPFMKRVKVDKGAKRASETNGKVGL